MALLCSILGHKRDSLHAWHDSLDWRSNCVRCGTLLVKDAFTQQWRAFDREKDFSLDRKGKPTVLPDRTPPVGKCGTDGAPAPTRTTGLLDRDS